jgi:hypothetical protein
MSQFLPLPAARRLLAEHSVDDRYLKRKKSWLTFLRILGPLRGYENLRWGATIRKTKLVGDPIFLLASGAAGPPIFTTSCGRIRNWEG